MQMEAPVFSFDWLARSGTQKSHQLMIRGLCKQIVTSDGEADERTGGSHQRSRKAIHREKADRDTSLQECRLTAW